PMPESRKTGATDSWITWAIAVMPESCSIAVYLTASRKHRVRDAPPHVHAHPGSQRADHEGRHRSDARAEPPADRAPDARAEEGQDLGHAGTCGRSGAGRKSPGSGAMARGSASAPRTIPPPCERRPAPALANRARRALQGRRLVVPRRLTRWNAQGLPVGTSQRLGHIDDLTHVVARVCERTVERLDD